MVYFTFTGIWSWMPWRRKSSRSRTGRRRPTFAWTPPWLLWHGLFRNYSHDCVFIAMLIVDPDFYIFLRTLSKGDHFFWTYCWSKRCFCSCWWTKPKVTCVLLGACITLAIFLAATTMYYRRKARQLQLENKVRFHLSWFVFHCWDYAEGCYQNIILLVVDMSLHIRHRHHHVITQPNTAKYRMGCPVHLCDFS